MRLILSREWTKPSTRSSIHSDPMAQSSPRSRAWWARRSRETRTVTSALASRPTRAWFAMPVRCGCSFAKGSDATAMTMAPARRACRASSAAAPLPAPPPSPAKSTTNSAPSSTGRAIASSRRIRCSANAGKAAHPSASMAWPSRSTWPSAPMRRLRSSASTASKRVVGQRRCAEAAHAQPRPPTPAMTI